MASVPLAVAQMAVMLPWKQGLFKSLLSVHTSPFPKTIPSLFAAVSKPNARLIMSLVLEEVFRIEYALRGCNELLGSLMRTLDVPTATLSLLAASCIEDTFP